MKEREIQFKTRLILGADPRVVLWRNQQGFYIENAATTCPVCQSKFRPRPGEPERGITYGLGGPGGSDLVGMLRGSGRMVGLELKTASGRVTTAQEKFIALVRSCGGFATVIRDASEALPAISRATEGEVE